MHCPARLYSAMPPKGSERSMSPAQAQANSNAFLSRWFTPAPQPTRPGRPFLPIKKRGPKPVVAKQVTAEVLYAAAVMGAAILPVQPVPAVTASIKRTRCNWSKGGALERLTKAKEDWLNKTGDLLTAQPDMSTWEFSKRVGIRHQRCIRMHTPMSRNSGGWAAMPASHRSSKKRLRNLLSMCFADGIVGMMG